MPRTFPSLRLGPSLWHPRCLQAALYALRGHGATVRPDPVRHGVPLGWEHIGLAGDRVWAAVAQPAAGVLRPVRDKPPLSTA